ncbi:hypothetical protein OnM2_065024, partial [Erysiphe neolycopersici]
MSNSPMNMSGTNDALPDSPIWQQLLTGWEIRVHSMRKRSISSESEIIFEELDPPSVNNTQAQVIEMAVTFGQGLALETGKIQSVPYEEQLSKQSNDSTTLLRVAQ